MVFPYAAAESAVHEHIAIVVEKVLAMVADIKEQSRAGSGFQLTDDALEDVVGVGYGVVVGVDEDFPHLVDDAFFGGQAAVVGVDAADDLSQVEVLHIGRETAETIGVAGGVFEMAAKGMQDDHLVALPLPRIDELRQRREEDGVEIGALELLVGLVETEVAGARYAVEELVSETLVGNPRSLVARFGKRLDEGALAIVVGGVVWRGGREEIGDGDGGEIGDGVATVERDDLFPPRRQTGRCRTLITIDLPVGIARSLANHEDDEVVGVGLLGDAETELLNLLALATDVVMNGKDMASGETEVERVGFLDAHESGHAFVFGVNGQPAYGVRGEMQSEAAYSPPDDDQGRGGETRAHGGDIFILHETADEEEIESPHRHGDEENEPIGSDQLHKLAFFRFETGEDEHHGGGGAVHDEMHQLHAARNKREGGNIKECAAAEDAQAQRVESDGGDEIDKAHTKAMHVACNKRAKQRWQ